MSARRRRHCALCGVSVYDRKKHEATKRHQANLAKRRDKARANRLHNATVPLIRHRGAEGIHARHQLIVRLHRNHRFRELLFQRLAARRRRIADGEADAESIHTCPAAKLLKDLRSSHDRLKTLVNQDLWFRSEQSARPVAGLAWEHTLHGQFLAASVPARAQVPLDRSSGFITNHTNKRTAPANVNFVDFVVGYDIVPGRHISKFIVVSAKTTGRNRFEEDEKVVSLGPAAYYIAVLKEPPTAVRHEHHAQVRTRIATDHPKKKDDRKHKLTIADMVAELVEATRPP